MARGPLVGVLLSIDTEFTPEALAWAARPIHLDPTAFNLVLVLVVTEETERRLNALNMMRLFQPYCTDQPRIEDKNMRALLGLAEDDANDGAPPRGIRDAEDPRARISGKELDGLRDMGGAPLDSRMGYVGKMRLRGRRPPILGSFCALEVTLYNLPSSARLIDPISLDDYLGLIQRAFGYTSESRNMEQVAERFPATLDWPARVDATIEVKQGFNLKEGHRQQWITHLLWPQH